MGRYYGVINSTQGHRVSSYWKGCPPSQAEMYLMFHRYGWKPTDRIDSYSYADGYTWVGNNWQSLSECEDCEPEEGYEETETHDPTPKPDLKLGFPGIPDHSNQKELTHLPDWQEHICQTCQYQFEANNLKTDQPQFDSVFHCN